MASPLSGFTVDIDERTETVCSTADDGDHQRKSKRAGASERLWRPTDAEPYGQRILQRSRVDALTRQCRAMPARPVDVLIVADLEQQVQLLGEQRVVILESVAEQRKGIDEGATADDHLGAALRQ